LTAVLTYKNNKFVYGINAGYLMYKNRV